MNNSSFKISICISVYNSERHLKKCLNSISNQTLKKELEIILVDDGSTDSSYEMMLDFQKQHPDQVKLIKQKNKGLAQGRQTGINHASGEYLAFLDTDDYFVNDALEKMYNNAVIQNADIVECVTSKDGQLINSNYSGLHNTKSILRDYFTSGVIPPMLWMRIYKRKLFKSTTLPNFHTNNEDVFAFPCLLYEANSIYYLKEQLHHYSTENENSVMNQLKDKSKGTKNQNNKLKTLQVPKHVQEHIGLENIEKSYNTEFILFKSRVILDFCLGNYNSVSAREIANIAFEKTLFNKKEINKALKTLKHYNRIIQILVNNLGLHVTIGVYRKLKHFQTLFLTRS